MDYQHLIVTQDEGVVTVQLNRPEKHNSLNALLMTELTEFARAYRSRADVRAIVLTGGTTLFSARRPNNNRKRCFKTPQHARNARAVISRAGHVSRMGRN